jgi:hypothetical protein
MHLGNQLPKIGNVHDTNHDDRKVATLSGSEPLLRLRWITVKNLGKVVTSVLRLGETA